MGERCPAAAAEHHRGVDPDLMCRYVRLRIGLAGFRSPVMVDRYSE